MCGMHDHLYNYTYLAYLNLGYVWFTLMIIFPKNLLSTISFYQPRGNYQSGRLISQRM
ncbi:hypothetical protein BDV23DRAFT_153997 [Aspergillus alliaceus]|uniref:Uncharacterized protein n=1 Tax=Petromyces alliaceus TaxID=209559 RepID=A0A5N7CA82_PETAA|nr:hypothetical protein BDV23DRAFT_153997 [Aspergillus alliaceus]